MKIGYAANIFLADERYKNGKLFSSPDGSLLHAFSLIHGLLSAGHDVYMLFPDRDEAFVKQKGKSAFASFSTQKRYNAYIGIKKCQHEITSFSLNLVWPELDLILLEWRMPTRYNQLPMTDHDFEPDLLLQSTLIEHYTNKQTPIIALDFDYKMSEEDDKKVTYVLELGFKRGVAHHFDVPFVTEDIEQFKHFRPKNKIVYVGNRAERDEAFDKFFGHGNNVVRYDVYGNWLEQGRNSKERWPHIHFHERIHPYQIHDAYMQSLATPLLLKDEWNKNGFMTIRAIETILFGSIPMLPYDFESPIQYPFQRIQNEENMLFIASFLQDEPVREYERRRAIEFFKDVHDVSHFVKKIETFL